MGDPIFPYFPVGLDIAASAIANGENTRISQLFPDSAESIEEIYADALQLAAFVAQTEMTLVR